jgi:hypothetical protein
MKTGANPACNRIGWRSRPRGRSRASQVALVAALLSSGILGGCAGLVSGAKTAIQAAFQLNPGSVNFGTVGVGKQSTQSIAVTNTGNTAISITQATVSNPQFSLPGAAFPMSLGTGQSANLMVAVTPTAAGQITGTLTATGNSGASPVAVSLLANAVAPAPQISLSSTNVQFGTVSDGSTGTSSLTVSNNGTADLTISLITLSGAEFGVSGIATPKTISAGQSATMSVTFQPTVAGAASGSLAITSNDPNTPTANVTLSGTGSSTATGQLKASPTSLSFGNVSVGSNATQTITLTNSGTLAVQITGVAASGTGVTATGVTTPLTLDPAGTATLSVTFAPTTAGSITGSVTVTSSASGSPMTIPLTGTGIQPSLTITPSSFAYGSVTDGQTKSQSFTLTNSGAASLTITQLAVGGAGYSISGLSTPTTLAAGASASFSAEFAPTTAGSLPGTVTVTSNAPGSPATISLSGTGVAASLTLTANPTSLSFGNINAGSSSSKSVTLTNSGTSSLTISQVTVSATDTTTSGFTLPVTLTSGQTQTMNVAFSPKTLETMSGNITVTTSQGATAVISVSGTGIQAGITLTPGSANLGSVTVGSSNSQTFQVSNPGNGVLTITAANVSGTGFSTSGLTLPLSVNPGQSSTFNAVFQPSAAGSVTGSISLVSNAPGSPTAIGLSGTGVAATELLTFSTNSIAFGSVNDGSSSTQGVTVTNTGNSNVKITGIAVSGTGYTLSGASTPVTLTPTQSTTFSVIFSPTTAGSLPGSVTVTSNATGSPATITLSGTGVQQTTHTVGLTWTASTSTVSGYNVYRSTTNGSGYGKINPSLVTTESYTDSSVSNSTTYYYVTTAVDSSGNESAYSNQATAAIP